ncbi:MAG TPA: 3-phosphoshikimate 1-carboxyvinyltransferase [Candidatus Omnitrophica bacterium]|nr:3-phosphoshikimate 1-carboxyvinyltransferase [Candidatus Omnitrophota bacterium]HBG63219.1 3-phosphoshikimate 1-carboxyvinyltransferase [Candidatus Omnitrophota bacterium]
MHMKQFDLSVEKTQSLKGQVKAPASKSYTIRALLCAGLNGEVKIRNPLYSEDTLAAIQCLKKLGAVIEKRDDGIVVKGFKGKPHIKGARINVGESGTLLRLILPLIALGAGKCRIEGRGTLLKRTNKPIAEALLLSGVTLKGKDEEFRLPIVIVGKGELKGGKVAVSAQISSQTVSSLLQVAPLAKKDVTIVVKDKVVSKPYIDVTLDVLRQAGITVQTQGYRRFYIKAGQHFRFKDNLAVGGDYSSAAFLMVAACLIVSDVVITGMRKDKQGDRKIIDILNSMGAKIRHRGDRVYINGPFELKGRDIDCSDTPDLVPILAVAACFAKGKTKIRNIGHLAHKESNRILTPVNELRKLGARIEAGRDSVTIRESVLHPAVVSSCNDHRIAMSLAVAGLRIGGLKIRNAEAIGKSYPDFVVDMKSLGAKMLRKRSI